MQFQYQPRSQHPVQSTPSVYSNTNPQYFPQTVDTFNQSFQAISNSQAPTPLGQVCEEIPMVSTSQNQLMVLSPPVGYFGDAASSSPSSVKFEEDIQAKMLGLNKDYSSHKRTQRLRTISQDGKQRYYKNYQEVQDLENSCDFIDINENTSSANHNLIVNIKTKEKVVRDGLGQAIRASSKKANDLSARAQYNRTQTTRHSKNQSTFTGANSVTANTSWLSKGLKQPFEINKKASALNHIVNAENINQIMWDQQQREARTSRNHYQVSQSNTYQSKLPQDLNYQMTFNDQKLSKITDFKQAYKYLKSKVPWASGSQYIQTLSSNNNNNNNLENQQSTSQISSSRNIHEHLYQLSKKKQVQMQMIKDQEEIAAASRSKSPFKDKTNTPNIKQSQCSNPQFQNISQKRTLDQFIQDQQLFEKKKQHKIEHQRQLKLEQELNKLSHPQGEKTPPRKSFQENKAVYDRLYSDSKKIEIKREEYSKKLQSEQSPFSPQLVSKTKNVMRSIDTSQKLYEDAQRRQEVMSSKDHIARITEMMQNNQKCENPQSIKHLIKRYLRGLDVAFNQRLDHDQIQTQQELQYILEDLGYLTDVKIKGQDQKVELLYQVLTNNNNLVISKKNIKTLLLALHGISRKQKQSKISAQDYITLASCKLGFVNNQGDYLINDDVQKEIMLNFNFMHLNRKDYLRQQDHADSPSQNQSHSPQINFRPSILEKSRNLADLFRQSLNNQLSQLGDRNKSRSVSKKSASRNENPSRSSMIPSNSIQSKSMSNFDQLFQHASLINMKIETKRDEKLKKELEQCTFQPELVTMRSKEGGLYFNQQSQAYERLIQHGKDRTKLEDKSTEEIDFERSKSECTFKPQLVARQSKTLTQQNPQTQKKQSVKDQKPNAQNKNQRSSLISQSLKKLQEQIQKSQAQITQEAKVIKGGKKKQTANDNANIILQPLIEEKLKNTTDNSQKFIGDGQTKGDRAVKEKLYSVALDEERLEKEEPILFANIHIGSGGQTARLVLFEEEEPKEVVFKFCQKYNLNEEVQEKLHTLIKNQLIQNQ